MFDQLSAEILASLIKGFPRTTRRTTKQNVDPAVHFVYSQVKTIGGGGPVGTALHQGVHQAVSKTRPKPPMQCWIWPLYYNYFWCLQEKKPDGRIKSLICQPSISFFFFRSWWFRCGIKNASIVAFIPEAGRRQHLPGWMHMRSHLALEFIRGL
jgi:hypothetical protein